MTYTSVSTDSFLETVVPFARLSSAALQSLASKSQLLRYRIGQPILRPESLPHQVVVIMEGQARLLGYDPYSRSPITLARLAKGDALGIAGLVRRVPCESAIASSEVVAMIIPATEFQKLLETQPDFAQGVCDHAYLAELFDLLGNHVKAQAHTHSDLPQRVEDVMALGVSVRTPSVGLLNPQSLEQNRTWFLSRGDLSGYQVGQTVDP
ncbi:MAG: cyclic nucleotide-binding domain-containing protein, partial [Cyanobacteria bacterium J06629_9]